jgi:hypothetical protein
VLTSPTKKRKAKNDRELAETEALNEIHQQLLKQISDNVYLISRVVALEKENDRLT